jgi:hypothetical protein
MMRSTHHDRYLVFFYFNAAALALSVMVVVVALVLAAFPRRNGPRFDRPLLTLMAMATVAFVVAYGTGACRDYAGVLVFCALVGLVVATFFCQLWVLSVSPVLTNDDDYELDDDEKYRGKIMAPLSLFAVTITYAGGLSTPGGFWDSAEARHRPGDAILHGKLLLVFFFFNTWQFVSSLQGIILVMWNKLQVRLAAFNLMAGLLYVICAYTIGSSRGRHQTVRLIFSLCAAVVAYAIIHMAVRGSLVKLARKLLPMQITGSR